MILYWFDKKYKKSWVQVQCVLHIKITFTLSLSHYIMVCIYFKLRIEQLKGLLVQK